MDEKNLKEKEVRVHILRDVELQEVLTSSTDLEYARKNSIKQKMREGNNVRKEK